MAMQKITLREIRYWPTPTAFSHVVGYKHRLIDLRTARAVVKRLRRRGVDAFHRPVMLRISSRAA